MRKLVWAHAVNNKKLLQQALHEGEINMIECDVAFGDLITAATTTTVQRDVILCHPPDTFSDLSFNDLLMTLTLMEPIHMPGLKLDFKDPAAVDVSLQLVKQHNWPNPKRLWLNADIR